MRFVGQAPACPFVFMYTEEMDLEGEKKKIKTAWIFPGGAARAVYTAGNFFALSELNIKPDIIIACSGSAPTSICYLTDKPEIIKKVWLESLSTKRFVNFLRFWKIVNVDYLIDEAIRKNNPLDMERFSQSKVLTFFPLTNTESGELEYFSNRDNIDFWQVIKAAVSVPICTKLSLKGSRVGEKFYSDSAGASRYELHVNKAVEEGANKIIVFDNWHTEDNSGKYFFSKIAAWLGNRVYRNNLLKHIKEIQNFVPPKSVEFVRLSPDKRLKMNRFEIDNRTARRIFKQGYDDVMARKDVLK